MSTEYNPMTMVLVIQGDEDNAVNECTERGFAVVKRHAVGNDLGSAILEVHDTRAPDGVYTGEDTLYTEPVQMNAAPTAIRLKEWFDSSFGRTQSAGDLLYYSVDRRTNRST